MFCKNCGNEIGENIKFCGACGQPVETLGEPEQTATEPVAETVVQTVSTEPVSFAEPNFASIEKKPKKKKRMGVLISVLAVLAACAVAVVALWAPIKGMFIKTFGSDADYFEYVETKGFESVTEAIAEQYGKLLGNAQKDQVATKGSIKLNVGESAITMVESLLSSFGGEMDLDWFKNISLEFYSNSNNSNMLSQALATINVNDKKLIDVACISDLLNGEFFVALPSLSNKYLGIEFANSGIANQQMMNFYSDKELYAALPTQNELQSLLDKYLSVVFDNLVVGNKSSETVAVDNIQEKLTTVQTMIDERVANNVLLAILKTAQTDKQLKTHIDDIAHYLVRKGMLSSSVDVYGEFKMGINELITEIESSSPQAGGFSIILTDYINSKHEVVGRKVSVDSEELFRYMVVRDGQNFAFEMVFDGFRAVGKGTEKKDVVNGEFSVVVSDTNVCDIILKNFKATDDGLNGSICIKPDLSLLSLLGIDRTASSAISALNPSLEFVFANKDGSTTVDVNVLSGGNLFVGLTISGEEVKPSAISKPSAQNVYDQDDIDDWLSEIDVTALYSQLKAVGIPSDLVDVLQYFMG